MRRALVSFASSDMTAALSRVNRQAESMNIFDMIYTFDESDLERDFLEQFRCKLILGSRGFGYWCWKPQVIIQVMNELSFGDCVLYADAGCHINLRGRNRLIEYFDMLSNETPILAFQNDPEDSLFGKSNPGIASWPNAHWTKGDLIDYLKMREREDVLKAQTFYATTFLMKKTGETLDFLEKWKDVFSYDFRLIDDSPSIAPNLPGFVEHRHDQAIFSLLCHNVKIQPISACEIVYPKIKGRGGDWKALRNFPIHARRDRGKKGVAGILKKIFDSIS